MQKLEIWLAEIRGWLSGKKTYLLAGLLVVTVLVLVFLGQMTPGVALTVALVFAGLLSASFRSAIQQHHVELLDLLVGISKAGIDLRAGNREAAIFDMRPAGEDAIKLVTSRPEVNS